MVLTRASAPAVFLLCAGSALAGPVFVGKVTLSDSYGTLGGEFNATPQAGFAITPVGLGGGPVFQTFCLEAFEGAGFGSPFCADTNDRTVASTTNANYAGGLHGGFQDPISNETAWLYANFILGTLAGYDYTPGAGRIASADALQNAIWTLEDENVIGDLKPGLATTFYNNAKTAVNNGYKNNGVVVLNLYTKDTAGARTENQDVLALVIVPLPSAAVSGLAAMGGLAFMRRRRA